MTTDWETLRKTMKRGPFSPIENDAVERRNCTTRIIVARDGSMRERVALQTPSAAHREELILCHYLRHHLQSFVEDGTEIEILGRDCPWDFDVALGNGERFFVEITAIADGRFQFEQEKREERLRGAAGLPTIRLRDLRNLNEMFDLPVLAEADDRHLDEPADLEVPNPLTPDAVRLLTGAIMARTQPIAEQIAAAVSAKVAKTHAGKDRTILILDYRGNYPDPDELLQAGGALSNLLEEAPFPDIWVYIGYFSGDHGEDAEFALTPLKLGEDKSRKLNELIERRGLDEFGRLVF